jgi:hypothetical protein
MKLTLKLSKIQTIWKNKTIISEISMIFKEKLVDTGLVLNQSCTLKKLFNSNDLWQ